MISIDTAMNDFVLPKIITYDREYYTTLEEELNKYICFVRKINNLSNRCVEKVIFNSNTILESIKSYYNANVWNAQKGVMRIISEYINSSHIVATVNENYAFKGCAPEKLRPSIYRNNTQYINI